MKKFICLFLSLGMLAFFAPSARAAAEAICVTDASSGEVVYESNAYARLPMASTTKIMTALTALENSSVSDIVTVSQNAANQEGSSAYLYAGDELTMLDLLYGLMLNSGNDAAVAIAEHIAGDADSFADMMNEKAREIGASDTHFTNPNGLPADGHYTTAYDLALIAGYAMQNEDFRTVVSAKSAEAHIINTGRTIEYYNHNKLLSTYDGCIGIKTGYTKAAGRCLVSAAERDNMTFIAVTLNDPDDWQDHKSLLDGCFSNYSAAAAVTGGDNADSGGSMVYAEDFYVTAKNGAEPDIEIENHMPSALEAPVNAGEKVGYAEIFKNGALVGAVDILAAKSVYLTESEAPRNETRALYGRFLNILRLFLL
ncbi:MAG: D-alanyl-D-alanine carboxypeptidase [Firmicutes bacterium]|nr:D-alanyl-D-alanine carboxypeptidase [Bacillota bacterium]